MSREGNRGVDRQHGNCCSQGAGCFHRVSGRTRLGLRLPGARARSGRQDPHRAKSLKPRLLSDRRDSAAAAAGRCRSCAGRLSGRHQRGERLFRRWQVHDPSFEDGSAPAFELYGLGFEHKHVPETQLYSNLTRRPIFVPSVGNYRQGMLVSVPLHLDTLPGKPDGADLHAALAKRMQTAPMSR